ncbi:MAG TPA: DUF5681 domain-containing protein [Roseiarcus sp.]|nr:DUF5681 domain-containing protein [Roseiarcus sp.]
MARCFDPPRFAEKGLAPTAGNTMKDNVNSTYVTVQPTVEEDEERVGNPPRAWRFRPGQSGNPRGRPKRAHGLGAVVARALGERVEATENGRKRRITKLEAAVTQLANSAAKGDLRATQLVLALYRDDPGRSALDAAERSRKPDAIVVAELVRRIRSSAP